MNMTELVKTNEGYRTQYFNKINALMQQGKSFSEYTRKIVAQTKKQQKSELRKKRQQGVIVSGATSKERIHKLKQILRQKIAEISSGTDDTKMKSVMISGINQKLAALERILSQIERQEAEAAKQRVRQHDRNYTNRKKRSIEKVYLSKDELTLNGGRKTPPCDAGMSIPQPEHVDITSSAEDIEPIMALFEDTNVDTVV